ncbi:LOW QUALITY PROTEIN: uncharacterized protein LOC129219546 [Uloborus diversus]|uniref:LOW QUALITY PROTEIN: uncharacterized protein LOC129219546 n=1 Tax=Uloborus diversus TaxID=327109 RepID=UPI002409BA9A|nr:LOW QUALITY PROTEIN: uncharacterized protein LOC129219546 [Uloborus diversus]
MPSFCAAVGCSSSSDKDICKENKVSFHGFPLKNEKLLREWMMKMRSESVTSKAVADNDSQQDKEVQTDSDVVAYLLEQLSLKDQQISLLQSKLFSLKKVKLNKNAFLSITGFTVETFDIVFEFLNLDLVNRGLTPEEQFFMFLVRVRCGCTLDFLCEQFCLTKSSVSRMLSAVIDSVYTKVKDIDIWLSKKQVQEFMPEAFALKYPNCRAILDCTEFAIQIPSNPRVQQLTFSYYKNRNTVKALIAITPSEALSYISDLWCGKISDKQLFSESGLLQHIQNDDILADRGFLIAAELAAKNCRLIMPHFLKQKIQFTVTERNQNQQVSNLRVHVERAISRIKKYQYFRGPIPRQCFGEVNKVFYILAFFTNFSNPLIKIE